jgi:hypothetical protein
MLLPVQVGLTCQTLCDVAAARAVLFYISLSGEDCEGASFLPEALLSHMLDLKIDLLSLNQESMPDDRC